MECHNHPDREATANCSVCGKAICPECSMEIAGNIYCKDCVNEIVTKSIMEKAVQESASAPAAATDEVAIVDYAGISGGDIYGNYYRLGNKLAGLEAPAGEIVRVRRLHLHDKFWLGEANFESTPTVGQYAEAKASSMLHEPKAALTGGQYGIKILKEQDLTMGMNSEGKMYLVEVVAL